MAGLVSQIGRVLFGKKLPQDNSNQPATPNFTYKAFPTSKGGTALEVQGAKTPVPTPKVKTYLQDAPDYTVTNDPKKPNIGGIHTGPAMLKRKPSAPRILT